MAARDARWKENVLPTIGPHQTPLTSRQVPIAMEQELLSRQSSLQQNDLEQLNSINGCRIVNVAELAKAVYELTAHSAACGGACFIESETKAGLAVVFSAARSKCGAHYSI